MEQLIYGPFISREQAKAQGLKQYFDGKQCIHGHVSARQVLNNACLACSRLRDKKRSGTTKRKASRSAARHRNIEVERRRDRERANLPHRVAARKKWKKENRELNVAISVRYTRERLKTDPAYRLERNLQRRLNHAIDPIRAEKSQPTMNLIGCDRDFLDQAP